MCLLWVFWTKRAVLQWHHTVLYTNIGCSHDTIVFVTLGTECCRFELASSRSLILVELKFVGLLAFYSWIFLSNHVDHDDVIKWKHFPRYWPFVRGIHRWPVDSPHKGQWGGALIFLLSAPEQTVEQTIDTPVIWDTIALIITSL